MLNKTNFMLIASIILCTSFTSCENPIGDVLLRTYSDPFDQAPVVDSFREVEKIFLSWDEDKGADEYVLLRAEDAVSPVFKEVYRGKELNYIDSISNGLNSSKMYLYRLDKRRGKVPFESEMVSYGYCSPKERDTNNNHTRENALFLGMGYAATGANLYCGKYKYKGTVVFEEDWYYVKVSARSIKTVVVTQTQPKINGTEDPLIFYLKDGYSLTNVGANFQLENQSLEDMYIPFKLQMKDFPSDKIEVVTYEVMVANEQPIN